MVTKDRYHKNGYFASHYTNAPIKAVLFDLDDVLMDKSSVSDRVYTEMLSKMKLRGYQLSSDISFHDKEQDIHSLAFLTKAFGNETAAKEARAIIIAEYKAMDIPAVRGAQKTLKLLKQKNIPFAVVSNVSDETLRYRFQELFGTEFADVPLFGGSKKPEHGNILKALEKLCISPDRRDVLFVGDNMHTDIRAAIAAGCYPVLFGKMDQEGLEKIQSHIEYSNPVGFAETHEDLQALIMQRTRNPAVTLPR